MFKRLTLFVANIMERRFLRHEIIAERYQIINHLGVGSYGNSYLVFDQVSQQKKVLKALRIHKRITKSGKAGFEYEKNLLYSIQHPGFPQYFEDGVYKKIPFYTMEYIEGKNFEQLIFSEGWTISELGAFKIAEELLTLIEYLHSKDIIHRDIRIPNVIFNGSKVRLIDLGLGRYLGQDKVDKRITKQIDLRKEINFQADFYGLGHFLLFLLYSNYSFEAHQKEKSWEEELDISSRAKHIIRRLLQLEPAYEHCSQIREDIGKMCF
jgi:serine/threonine protein kinase